MLYNLDTMNGELFEVVNFVATTHPLGQKRCRRGDACRITSYFVLYLNYISITKNLQGRHFRLPNFFLLCLFPFHLAQRHGYPLEFYFIPQDASSAGRQVGAGGGDGEDAGLLSHEV